MTQKALLCISPLCNNNIPIHGMHKHRAQSSALPLQRFVLQRAFRGTAHDKF